jgi:hypothetical protein
MRRKFTGVLLAIILAAFALGVAGCGTDTDAEVASENLSKAAEQFEVDRRVVVYNGITDKVKLEVEGPCNIEDERIQLEITCALSGVGTGHPQAIKNFAGLSDNVTYYVEQLHPIGVSTTQYRVIFKPEAIIPDFDRP